MLKKIDASDFPNSPEIYEEEFKNILNGITYCYKMMVEDKVSVPSNNENKIRDLLLLNYLKKKEIKTKANLTYYRFDRETLEDHTNGRIDIRVISKNDFEIDEAYYIIECKRLDNEILTGTSGLNAKYIEEGLLRFVESKYSTYYGINGMIGFVVKKIDISKNIENINRLLKNNFKQSNTIKELKFIDFIKNFEYSYISEHNNNMNKKIKLYHLMFDFHSNTYIMKQPKKDKPS